MLSRSAQFRIDHPKHFFLELEDVPSLEAYLRSRGLLAKEDAVLSATLPGAGNMNCTLRVQTNNGSYVVKQARPWVEKYPQFVAPWERACREAEFYQLIASAPRLAEMMPGLRHFDAESHLLVLDDLEDAVDYTGIYRGEAFQPWELLSIAEFLSILHASFDHLDASASLTNREMRALNHAHIFEIPLLANNGLDLEAITVGLSDVSKSLRSDAAFCREVARLGREVYLADGPCLLHGDFFPGSLLRTAAGPRVIDPEFGFFGRPEFDVAVFLAHLLIADQPENLKQVWRNAYEPRAGFDNGLMLQLVGVEIMRRLIGYAQLPIRHGITRKRELLETARILVLEPHRLHVVTQEMNTN